MAENKVVYDGYTAREGGVVSWAIFNSEQAKDTENIYPTNDTDIRFSLKKPVEETKYLTNIDVQAIQAIKGNGVGHKGKSVNEFTSQEIEDTEAFAKKYWAELGAKSPFFRAWFGDWRAYDTTAVKVATKKGVTRVTVRGGKIEGAVHNTDTGWDIQISGKLFNEKGHNSTSVTSARPYLDYMDDIVQNAVLLDSYTIPTEHTKSPNSTMMHSLYAVVDDGNGAVLVKLYIEEMYNPNNKGTDKRTYQLQNIENQQSNAKGSSKNSSPVISTADIATVSDLFNVVKQKDADFKPNPASAARNADGTPKAVYHGTPVKRKFNTFKTNGSAVWFTPVHLIKLLI